MSEIIQTKCCSKCKEIKPLSEFYKNRASNDKICKACRSKQVKEYRRTEEYRIARKNYRQTEKYKAHNKRCNQSEAGRASINRYYQTEKGKANYRKMAFLYRTRYPKRIKASNAVMYAIKTGKLPQPDTLQCHYCFAQAKEYHHWHDYEPEHWLDVIPVCRKCHTRLHLKIA